MSPFQKITIATNSRIYFQTQRRSHYDVCMTHIKFTSSTHERNYTTIKAESLVH